MALAPFFDKTALAAATVLRGFDRDSFAERLEAQLVEVRWSEAVRPPQEAVCAMELVVNLLSRLYPRMQIRSVGGSSPLVRDRLLSLARSINPLGEFADSGGQATVRVMIGPDGDWVPDGVPTVFVGSNAWILEISTSKPLLSGSTDNPFGAAAAACLAVANVFRIVFGDQLESPKLDGHVRLSVLDFDGESDAKQNPAQAGVDIGEVYLVGAGAIGSGFLWALSRAPFITGDLHVVDGETIAASNPQRYVIALPADENVLKVDIASREFESHGSTVRVHRHGMTWGRLLGSLGTVPTFGRVAVAVDSARDRIAVQAALPRRLFNAWTQAGDLGISRHSFGEGNACLACLYMPEGRTKNEDELIAHAVNLPGRLIDVRQLLYTNVPIGEEWIRLMAEALGVPFEPLLSFADRPLRAFYSEAICGGAVLRLQEGSNLGGATEVPMAFQSALAGVLLAASVVADAAGYAVPAGTKVVLDVLRPIGSYLTVPVAAHPSGRCICHDEDYLASYVARHAVAV